jgi:hypothetical protein
MRLASDTGFGSYSPANTRRVSEHPSTPGGRGHGGARSFVSSGLSTNTSRWRRAFHYNLLGEVGRAEERMPEVAYIHPGPLGRKEAMRLLLAQLERDV